MQLTAFSEALVACRDQVEGVNLAYGEGVNLAYGTRTRQSAKVPMLHGHAHFADEVIPIPPHWPSLTASL